MKMELWCPAYYPHSGTGAVLCPIQTPRHYRQPPRSPLQLPRTWPQQDGLAFHVSPETTTVASLMRIVRA